MRGFPSLTKASLPPHLGQSPTSSKPSPGQYPESGCSSGPLIHCTSCLPPGASHWLPSLHRCWLGRRAVGLPCRQATVGKFRGQLRARKRFPCSDPALEHGTAQHSHQSLLEIPGCAQLMAPPACPPKKWLEAREPRHQPREGMIPASPSWRSRPKAPLQDTEVFWLVCNSPPQIPLVIKLLSALMTVEETEHTCRFVGRGGGKRGCNMKA